jgi:tetratricopeptide (TPR) repeat protein
MADFDGDSPQDRLAQEAEELMRQRRFSDAVRRYRDLHQQEPTDLWASLGYVSALECAGNVDEAEVALEEAASQHRRSAALHRFRHLFFVRREDRARASSSQGAVGRALEDGPIDQLADLYFNQGRYHEALAEFDRLIRDHDLDDGGLRAGVLARSGACLRQLGNLDEAHERLLASLTLESDSHWTLAELAETERALRNVDAARRRYNEALKTKPDDHWTRGHLAQLEFEHGNADKAVALYEEIIAAQPKAIWAKVELAQVLFEREPARAEALCRAALEDDPTYPWALAQLGNIARRSGRLDEARKHFQDAAAASPGAVWIIHELADTCRRLGRREEAFTHLEHAGRIDPYDAVTHGYLADFLRQDGRNREAMANLEKAVQLDQQYTWAWRELAELRALAGRHADADAAYKQAVELSPDEPVNDGLRAFLLRHRGDRAAAVPWLERAVAAQPDYLWAWRELVDWYLESGQHVRAEQAARQALTHIPDHHALMAMLGEALRRQGRLVEAGELLGGPIIAGTDNPQVWAVQAQVAASAGDFPSAVQLMKRANELEPGIEHQVLLAQLHLASGDLDAAEPLVRKLLSVPSPIAPSFELGAVLAERRGDLDGAIEVCEAGLSGPCQDEARLQVRRARLIAQRDPGRLGEMAETAARLVLEPARTGLPWRDCAQMLAEAGRGVLARRACFRLIDEAGPDRTAEARAWLTLAEVEMHLDQHGAAQQALEQSLLHDATLPTAHLVGAVLAELRNEPDRAARHLETVLNLIDAEITEGESAERFAPLRQQVAGLWERIGRHERSEAVWDALVAAHPGAPEYAIERASFLLRRDRDAEAEAAAAPLIARDEVVATPQGVRLLRELALRRAVKTSPAAALELFAARMALLDTPCHLLGAQFALVADDHAACERHLKAIADVAEQRRTVGLLRTRLLLSQRRAEDAEKLITALWAEEQDQECAAILAETLAWQGRWQEALTVLDHPGLPAHPGQERGLIAALVALELHGEEAALARLARLRFDPRAGLMRLCATAWPHLWAEGGRERLQPDDLLTVPPFPRAVQRLAVALQRQGQGVRAADLLEMVAGHLMERDPAAAKRLLAVAVDVLCRAGHRRRAFGLARSSGVWRAWLRLCWPG